MEKEITTKIIVDLYEMRVSTFNKYSSKSELVMDNFKYNFFTSAIAQLCSKYQITDRDIEAELHSRNVKKQKERYQITKITNGLWRLEWENGGFSEHNTKDGAEKMVLQVNQCRE